MNQISLDRTEFQTFWAEWEEIIEAVPGLKEEMLEAIGKRVQQELHRAIDRSSLHDPRGRVKSWQNPHIGSGKGYVAVRADTGTVYSGYHDNHRDTPILLLTNTLNSGHTLRDSKSGRAKRYRPRIHSKTALSGRVKGFHFYKNVAAKANQIAIDEAQTFLQRLGGEID